MIDNAISRPVVEWLRQNQVSDDYFFDAPITVDRENGTVTVETFMRTPLGGLMLHGNGHTFTEPRTYPLIAEPPAGLLEAYERLRQRSIEESSAAAAIRRETLHSIIEHLNGAGFSEAAEHLVLAKMTGSPIPSRELVRFEVEAARLAPRADGGVWLTPGCKVVVRDSARLYRAGGLTVGLLDWCEAFDDGVLLLSGRALPRVAAEFIERSLYPSLDIFVHEWADEPTCQAAASAEIVSAMVQDIASYPWAKGAPDVRP